MCDMYGMIEKLCAEKGIKPGKMCADLGISRGVLGDLKTGRTKSLSAETLSKVASYLGVTVDYFLGKEKTPPTDGEVLHLENTYLRLAKGAKELGLDDDDVDLILALYRKHRKKNQ